eukprot:5320847-Prymnesium_polylepis.1
MDAALHPPRAPLPADATARSAHAPLALCAPRHDTPPVERRVGSAATRDHTREVPPPRGAR